MMKILAFSLITAALLSAQEPAVQKAASSSTAIPAQATEVGPNVYRYLDPNGKPWIYIRTPFGISKREDKQAAQPLTSDLSLTKIIDLGDKVRFEIQTPFGTSVSIRPKAELTVEQTALLSESAAEKQ